MSKAGGALALLAAVAASAVGLWLGQASSLSERAQMRELTPAAVEKPEPEPELPVAPLEGLVVALDPGHNSQNAANPGVINALVPDGRGGLKACNTVGTSTNDGYPEYAFTWDVAERLGNILEAEGATVLFTHDGDGVGPCVNERGSFAQDHDADVMVSIHGNGSESPSIEGFFAILVNTPLHESQGEPSEELANAIIDALAEAEFPPSNAVAGAVSRRDDIATLNFAERPAVLMELAEFRNPTEAALVQAAEGRQRYAEALAAGIAGWAAQAGLVGIVDSAAD